MKRVVITGASGFIGRSASLLFSRYGIKILAVDVFDRPPAEFASTDIEYLSCDVGKSNELKCAMMQFGADTILSLAWVGTEPSKRNDRSLQRVNIENTMHTLSVAAECGVRRFIGVGSAREIEYEYALTTGSALPDDCYGEAKYETHKSCMLEAQNAGIECIWAIITNAYGPSCPENRLVPYLLEHFTSGRSPILTSCEQYYDLIFVEDVARALFLLGENGKPGKTYLIGSGEYRRLKDYVREIAKAAGYSGEILFGARDFTGVYVPASAFTTSEIEKDCGFKPRVSLAEGIEAEIKSMAGND